MRARAVNCETPRSVHPPVISTSILFHLIYRACNSWNTPISGSILSVESFSPGHVDAAPSPRSGVVREILGNSRCTHSEKQHGAFHNATAYYSWRFRETHTAGSGPKHRALDRVPPRRRLAGGVVVPLSITRERTPPRLSVFPSNTRRTSD